MEWKNSENILENIILNAKDADKSRMNSFLSDDEMRKGIPSYLSLSLSKFTFSRIFSACCLPFVWWKGQEGIRIPCATGVIPVCYRDARFFQNLMGWEPLHMTVAGSSHWENLKGCLCTALAVLRFLFIVRSVVSILLNLPLSFSAWQVCFFAPGLS